MWMDTFPLDAIPAFFVVLLMLLPVILWVITLVSIVSSNNWTPGMKALWALAALPSGLIGMLCWFIWGRKEGNKLAIEYYGGQLPTAVAPYGQQIPGTYATQPRTDVPAAPAAQATMPPAPAELADTSQTGAPGAITNEPQTGAPGPITNEYVTGQGQRFNQGGAVGTTQAFTSETDDAVKNDDDENEGDVNKD